MNFDSSRGLVRFEGFELDLRAGELHADAGKTFRLAEQPFRILIMLLQRTGEVLTREDIRKKLWPNDTVVEFEHSISAAMNRLRQMLGDAADRPHFIETLARRGYRWMVSVEWVESTPTSAAADLPQETGSRSLIGKRVSRYRVVEILGSGGMGLVCKAEDLKLGRLVALKFLPEELARDPAALERFEREARAASALNHPNICTIHGAEEHEGQPFIVMELLEGETLRDWLKRAPTLEPSLEIARQVLEALRAAHRAGIVHRDLKPENIMVRFDGYVKVLDFGVAKLMPASPLLGTKGTVTPALSRPGQIVGTLGYMSPEQILGQHTDQRSDLFSFGVILYEMLTGQHPWPGTSPVDRLHAILHDDPLMPFLGWVRNYAPLCRRFSPRVRQSGIRQPRRF
jgi:DNA-binding winged helix-turn-helix (wHTH) protein/predicted Ser/Thr protein kinase